MPVTYTLPEMIEALENRDFRSFCFADNYAFINSQDAGQIILQAPDNTIPEETAALAVGVLKHLDECVAKAQSRLEHFDLKKDKWFPDAFDKGFEIIEIYFGRYGYGGEQITPTYGFAITFGTVNYYPCNFTVKYHPKDMNPFAVEEWVQ